MKKTLSNLKESFLSIMPIILIVLLLSFTGVSKLGKYDYILLITSTILLIVGLSIFQVGTQKSLVKVGQHMGTSLSRQKNLFLVIIVVLLLGSLVTCAEPSIMLLSRQTPIPAWLLIIFISVGVGAFVSIGVLRIIYHKNLKVWMITAYGLVFALLLLIDSNTYAPLIFDSSGATTGSATVPFLLSLGAGVAMVRGGKSAKDDSFGLIGIASLGPLISLTILIIFNSNGVTTYTNNVIETNDPNIFRKYMVQLLPTINEDGLGNNGTMLEVLIALLPILVIFLIYEKIFIKLPKSEILRILIGFFYTFIGLSIFLCAIQTAMMPIGRYVGDGLGMLSPFLVILICFAIGLVTILCEPAIHVLTKQIEDISDGGISKVSVLLTLSIGVGIAIMLCAIRAIYDFPIVYYLVPGYIIAIALSFISPNLYTAMAFDSGGVASGPMTTSFVLPMIIGISYAFGATDQMIMGRAFGVIAMVAMTPIIAIQILGIIEKYNKKKMAKAYFNSPI
nr:DUF1538 domain-containing protein [Gammaproteobacteria bacterium]